MTRIVLFRGRDGSYTGFSVKGHSGYAEAGADIVCAAVSSLTTTCVNALEGVAGVQPEVRRDDAVPLLEVRLPQSGEASRAHDAQVLLAALRQGLSDLTQTYPQYVRLSIQERRETP